MIVMEHPAYLIALLSLLLLASNWLSKKPVLRSFGIALLVIIAGAVASNTGLIPTGANPTYDTIFNYIAPASLFLLLLDVNLAQLRQTGLPILIVFLVGSLGTVTGVIAGMFVLGDSDLFQGLYAPLAGMFAGTYTGGSINFNAVALEYNVMENGLVYGSAVAVDNVLTTLWFFVTIAFPVVLQRWLPRKQGERVSEPAENKLAPLPAADESARLDLGSLSFWLALSGAALVVSDGLTSALSGLGVTIPSIIILTTLALVLAQIPFIHKRKGNMFLGSWGIYLFLTVVGAFCDLAAISSAGPLALMLLILVLITVALHGLFTFGTAYLLGYDWQLAAIASQANVGGGTTAMALAKNFGRNELILPAIIIGSLGNALGTYLGFLVAGFL
ncbi:DUF819 domain-containing protein [Robiginitalea sp. SC105]|uniref:DUF819 family protein n=1 Tax=Robiginitalea sp. SC105 TaxID=2762332 RepID=UPI00163B35B4|nr:DUF819 family protein [Robiginitalea sp. SC105]MBC2840546.1 DUF819 family protein [Robiginitalea sp. SC105]